MKNKLTISLLFFMCICFSQNNSEKKLPIEKKWIKNKSYTMDWYLLKENNPIKIGEVNTCIQKDEKTITIVTHVFLSNAKETWIDTTIADLKTFTPIRHHSINKQREIDISFGKIISGSYYDKSNNIRHSICDTTTQTYYDSNAYPILLSYLPLNENFSQTITIYDYKPETDKHFSHAFINQVRSDTITTKGVKFKVWIIRVKDEISNGEHVYYFNQANRNLIKHEMLIKQQKMLLINKE